MSGAVKKITKKMTSILRPVEDFPAFLATPLLDMVSPPTR
jgi:hypothetical protein